MLNFAKLKNYSFTNNKFFWWLLFGLIVFAWWKFRLGFLAPRSGDAWIYWYAGKEVLSGNLPYRDFFYSSPPLIPYFTALWQMLFGFNLTTALIVPHILTIISGFLIFLFFSLQKKYQAGLLAAIAFLFTGAVFFQADKLFCSIIMAPFILLGLFFFEQKKFFYSGLFFGLATLTKIYGIVPAIFLLPLIKNRKDFFSFFWGGFVSFGIPSLVFLTIMGREYLDLIIFNHFQKPVLYRIPVFLAFLRYDTALLITLVAGFWLERKNFLLKPAILASTGSIIFFSFFNEIFYLYFVIVVAILSVLLGHMLIERDRIFKKFILPIILLVLTYNAFFNTLSYYKHISQLGQIPDFPKMLEIIKQETKPGDQIYGPGQLATLLALETNRNFFGKSFDTYLKWTIVKGLSLEDRTAQAKQAKVPLIVSVEDQFGGDNKILRLMELPKEFLIKNCKILAKFGYNEYTFWKCFSFKE